mmetsp:Transcript_13680/g.15701  ORF Transcript_13680/g.15701 Transcript_13680/m.15701 type:complete len:279 (+) Transcript_13680:56-892(+)|eukprot:CAMPEP_0171308838 /NCGR_PEP_ID=MMETSP0816-20121228/18955_1 /TAXON_ID=420281 /ORGANISM="Proboscia inermis, Strain CCAP1064/1" /LENGTH=278 /DNA_ID=CAMNT_0011791989 /DNA_START=38 /DNA_END=874 /DNA_ORIENTATION=+
MGDDGFDDYGYSSEQACKVYDGEDQFTIWVQVILAFLALIALYIKRLRETPRRTFNTWFLDVSKQAVGATYAHVLNMFVANIIAANVRGEQSLTDECAWYAINYVMDTVFGLIICIGLLGLLDHFANKFHWVSLKDTGVYHGSEGMIHWVNQVIAWILVLTITKVALCVVMWCVSPFLAYWGQILFGPFQSNIRFELLFVMIFFPGVLNIVYFWIMDSFLKAKSHHADAHENDENEAADSKTETLISEEDEGDGTRTGNYKEPSISNIDPPSTKPEII